ncbi:MAG: RES family NAD+ phosphorylase [Candidatus Pedobacter colombiensis]|uniref:RES family NAD+ phosphorylase n=1 Tax=Candidatus Pedobacter colombiensis TaxID=3121371 RepID=A0AAJ6B7N0_9SPHI|nr:RES family NAD+ phosphorylase [Pedobacter sp.]WEK21272.1 MAG: RES family NAD+ phosphorylase [Pedobacter sp.]
MQVFRIALAKYATALNASGRAARWNPNDIEMIYTAGSRSLACLENVVHRNQVGLNHLFKVMTIVIPDDLCMQTIEQKKLPTNWTEFNQIPITQKLGEDWIKERKSAILKVPSSIIQAEYNYVINPLHPDFKSIKLLKFEDFIFDKRIKMS